MKNLTKLPEDILNYIGLFLDNSDQINFFSCSKKMYNNGYLFCNYLFGKSLSQNYAVDLYLKSYRFLESCYYLLGHDFGGFSQTGNKLLLNWIETPYSQRRPYEAILKQLLDKHSLDSYGDEEKIEYINVRCSPEEKSKYFRFAKNLFIDLFSTKNYIKMDTFTIGTFLLMSRSDSFKELAKLLYLIQEVSHDPTLQSQIDILKNQSEWLQLYIEIQRQFPKNILNTHSNIMNEEGFLLHIYNEAFKYLILLRILDYLCDDSIKNHKNPHLKLILENQPCLINMSLGGFSPSFIHTAIKCFNFDILCFLIENGGDINKNQKECIDTFPEIEFSMKSSSSPLLYALQILIYMEEKEIEGFQENYLPKFEKIINKLLESGADIHKKAALDYEFSLARHSNNEQLSQNITPMEFCRLVSDEDHISEVMELLNKVILIDNKNSRYCAIL